MTEQSICELDDVATKNVPNKREKMSKEKAEEQQEDYQATVNCKTTSSRLMFL